MTGMTSHEDHQSRLDWWRRQIQRQPKTHLTIADFCRQLGVSVPTFYYWKRRVQAGLGTPPAPVAEASRSRPPTTAATPFLPVSIVDPDAGTHLEIELANTCVVRLRGRLSPRLLRAAITAAGERSAASIWSLRFTCRGQCKRRYSESLPEPRSGAAPGSAPVAARVALSLDDLALWQRFWSSFTPSSVAFVSFR